MSSKIPVGVLGATGSVGQKFVQLLENHPDFEIKEIAASDRSAGKKYSEAVNWILGEKIPGSIASLNVKSCTDNFESKILFSALDAVVAGEIEHELAGRGHYIISNAKNHRWDEDVPLMIPEVNSDHLELLKQQSYNGGGIVTNPNCSTIGLILALKPLHDAFGLEKVNVVTMQALSGAGYPGVASLNIIDNVVPFIGGEEEKLETEPKKILGKINNGKIQLADIRISAQTNRVPVLDGHLETVQVKFNRKASREEIIKVWDEFRGDPQELKLSFAPDKPIHYFTESNYPQPRLHRNIDKGMAAAVGRLRECPIFDWKFVVLSHNTIRGAAGGTILIAELMKAKGYL